MHPKDLKTFKQKVEDCSMVVCRDQHTLEACEICKGVGWYLAEEFNLQNDKTKEVLKECDVCQGDGRIVRIKRWIEFQADAPEVRVVPYKTFEGDPWFDKEIAVKVKLDFCNPRLEDKYPELKKLTYDEYDKALPKYETLDRIENPERWNQNGRK